jgi:hypothetical protein
VSTFRFSRSSFLFIIQHISTISCLHTTPRPLNHFPNKFNNVVNAAPASNYWKHHFLCKIQQWETRHHFLWFLQLPQNFMTSPRHSTISLASPSAQMFFSTALYNNHSVNLSNFIIPLLPSEQNSEHNRTRLSTTPQPPQIITQFFLLNQVRPAWFFLLPCAHSSQQYAIFSVETSPLPGSNKRDQLFLWNQVCLVLFLCCRVLTTYSCMLYFRKRQA